VAIVLRALRIKAIAGRRTVIGFAREAAMLPGSISFALWSPAPRAVKPAYFLASRRRGSASQARSFARGRAARCRIHLLH
jgi:hypothetical protein